MDGCGDVPNGRAQTQGKPGFRDEIRGMGPGDMYAEHLAVAPSETILNMPGSSLMACALPSSRIWNVAVRTSRPASEACASASPTQPISGDVKMPDGTAE